MCNQEMMCVHNLHGCLHNENVIKYNKPNLLKKSN